MPLFGGHRSYFGAVGLFLGNGSTASWQIPVEKACEYLDRMGEFQASSAATELACLPIPTGLYVSGAEPFAQIDDLERLLDCALRNRMLAELVTTVSWVDSQGTANSVIERFAKKVHLLTVVTSQADSSAMGLPGSNTCLGRCASSTSTHRSGARSAQASHFLAKCSPSKSLTAIPPSFGWSPARAPPPTAPNGRPATCSRHRHGMRAAPS